MKRSLMVQYEATQGQRHLVFWRDKLTEPGFVYVIRAADGGPIKIGIATRPERRLASLQTGNPKLLRLLHCIPGDRQLELAFHKRLAKSRGLGEWFEGPDVPEFLEYMENLAGRMVATYDGQGIAPGVTAHTPVTESDVTREDRERRWRYIGRLWVEGWNKERIRLAVNRTAEDLEIEILRMRAEGGYELDEVLITKAATRERLFCPEPRGTGTFRLLRPPRRKRDPAPITVRFVEPQPQPPPPLSPAHARMAKVLGISHDEWRERGLGRSEAA